MKEVPIFILCQSFAKQSYLSSKLHFHTFPLENLRNLLFSLILSFIQFPELFYFL